MKKLAVCIAVLFSLPAYAYPAQYQQTCGVCHSSGALGAPKAHDINAWSALLASKSMQQLIINTKNGYKNMPARGLCNNCTDSDIEQLINFMAKSKP